MSHCSWTIFDDKNSQMLEAGVSHPSLIHPITDVGFIDLCHPLRKYFVTRTVGCKSPPFQGPLISLLPPLENPLVPSWFYPGPSTVQSPPSPLRNPSSSPTPAWSSGMAGHFKGGSQQTLAIRLLSHPAYISSSTQPTL